MTQELYGQAYRQGFTRTLRLLRSRGASLDTAEDMAQAGWLQGWRRIEQLRDEGMVLSWVNQIALNYFRRGIQTQARYEALSEHHCDDGIDSAPVDVAKILEFCKPGERLLFEQQLGGLTAKEIAEREGVSVTAIRIRFVRARKAVRESAEGRTRQRREHLTAHENSPTSAGI